MIVVIIFSAAIVATAVLYILWVIDLDKREKAYKADLLNLSRKYSELRTQRAHLQAREDSVKKQEAKIEAEKQDIADQLNALLYKHHELNEKEKALTEREAELANKKADVSTREAILGFMGVPEVPDIIEPVDEPQKVVEKPHSPAYVCPLCGGKMYGRSDGKNTEYVCSDCGYIATDVTAYKKPVKKAKKGGKK